MGSISVSGCGASGGGSSSGGKVVASSKSVKKVGASGNVVMHGLCIYVGMDSTASVKIDNHLYSSTCSI